MDFTSHYESPLGGITVASDGVSLVGIWFDGQAHFGSTLAAEYRQSDTLPVIVSAKRWLDKYFDGNALMWPCSGGVEGGSEMPLLLRGSDFSCRVWRRLCEIPYGETLTYGQLARDIGCCSARAIGAAVGRNPISLIVPCHRVIASDGSLAGYAAGRQRKEWLLLHEWHSAKKQQGCCTRQPCYL